jgi:hypothetical protein
LLALLALLLFLAFFKRLRTASGHGDLLSIARFARSMLSRHGHMRPVRPRREMLYGLAG